MVNPYFSKFPEGSFLICWYRQVQPNPRVRSLPHVLVVPRKCDSPSEFGKFWKAVPVGVTYLGQLRIGTVVVDGEISGQLEIPEEQFDVDFTPGSWRFVEGRQLESSFSQIPWLTGLVSSGPMLVFSLADGRSLWVPCIEFFSRCYGTSQEIKRILSTYIWPEAERRLFLPVDESDSADCWRIKLGRGLNSYNATFLAHVRHDLYSQRCAKSIYAQIEVGISNGRERVFLEVRPWFQGPAELLVQGYWLDDDQYLALRVEGCSEPRGVPIEVVEEKLEEGSSSDATRAPTVPVESQRSVPDTLSLTDDSEPDRGSGFIKVADPGFKILGERRVVTRVTETRPRDESPAVRAARNEELAATLYSSTDPSSTGKGVGRVDLPAPSIMDSKGVLLDMWKTLIYLQNIGLITSVCWYTFEHGYQSSSPPKLIPFPPLGRDVEVTKSVRNWVLLNPHDDADTKLRGMLVMCCLVKGTLVYLVEIQRRPDAGDAFRGLVFTLRPNAELDDWLLEFRSRIRDRQGVIKGRVDLTAACPGHADVFKHCRSRDDSEPCEAAVYNALSKIGLTLPR